MKINNLNAAGAMGIVSGVLAEIKSVDPRRPWAWPRSIRALSYVAIALSSLVLVASVDWVMQLDDYNESKNKELALRADYAGKRAQALNLNEVKSQLKETNESFGALLKQLPNKSEMDVLLTDINQAGMGRGLQFELFRPGTERIAENGMFAELPIEIKVTGAYDELAKFAESVSKLPRIVTLNDLSLVAAGKRGVTLSAKAKTFRYLSDAEVEQYRKQEAEKEKGAK